MERRKIQKTGIATYTVSLPKSWIVKNKIKAGDLISITEDKDKSLRLNLSEKEEEAKEEIISIKDYSDVTEVVRKFTSHYLNGAGKITIIFDADVSASYKKEIIAHSKKLIGFEIVEETESKIVLQDFFSSNYLSIEKTIKRAFNISKIMLAEAKKTVSKEQRSLENVELWEEETDKLYLLVRRQLNFAIHSSLILRQLKISLHECLNYLILIGSIEKITDALKEIAECGVKLDKPNDKYGPMIISTCDELMKTYEQAINAVFKRDFALANKTLDQNKRIMKNIPLKKDTLTVDAQSMLTYQMIFNLHTAVNFVSEIAEIGLDI